MLGNIFSQPLWTISVIFGTVLLYHIVDTAGAPQYELMMKCAACQAVKIREYTCEVECHSSGKSNGSTIETPSSISDRNLAIKM